jgi:hypothetical protein
MPTLLGDLLYADIFDIDDGIFNIDGVTWQAHGQAGAARCCRRPGGRRQPTVLFSQNKPASGTSLSEQSSTSYQPQAKRMA